MSKAGASGSSNKGNSVPWRTNAMISLLTICRDLDQRSTRMKKESKSEEWWHEAAQRLMVIEPNLGQVNGEECERRFAEIEEKYKERMDGNSCRLRQLEALLVVEAEQEVEAVELPQAPLIQQQDPNAVNVSSSRWTATETHVMIQIHSELEDRVPIYRIWDDISERMKGLQFDRSSADCKEKWCSLLVHYGKVKKAKKNHHKLGDDCKDWPFFSILDAIHLIRRGNAPVHGNCLDVLLEAIDAVSSTEAE